MTEQEWLACTYTTPLLKFLQGRASERRLRLFAVACCRRVWTLLEAKWDKRAIEVVEAFADGRATGKELRAAAEAAWSGLIEPAQATLEGDAAWAAEAATALAAVVAAEAAWAEGKAGATAALVAGSERQAQAKLLRCIFRNPFRPAPVIPPAVLAWKGGAVRRLALGIYNRRAFDRLPVLGDALKQAGSDNADILAHCREPGPHVRGCWVVDALLGKQ
jgi:hypothetical protein